MTLLVEEPIDIANYAEDIERVAADTANNAEDTGNNAEDTANNAEDIQDDKENEPNNVQEPQEIVAAPVAKRKPGRPAGSRNKEPGKPRKPRAKKVEVVEEPIEEVFEDPIEEPQYQRIPTVATTSKEERMLRLLSDHAKTRRARKVALWKSWF